MTPSLQEPPATKERPILFRGSMVRAILDGRKTQTRRIVKESPIAAGPNWTLWYDKKMDAQINGVQFAKLRCPYGNHGDRLWVRETWQPFRTQTEAERARVAKILERFRAGKVTDIVAEAQEMCAVGRTGELSYLYAADYGDWAYDVDSDLKPWKPSIFMPRQASRITLEITDVRVERVQDISEEDAEAEGTDRQFQMDIGDFIHRKNVDFEAISTYRIGYKNLWNSINGNWDENPWVWVIEFRKVAR